MKDYFYGENAIDFVPAESNPHRVRITALMVLLAFLLGGCAAAEPAKVCYLKALGATEDGFTVVAQQCMTPEAFAESQK